MTEALFVFDGFNRLILRHALVFYNLISDGEELFVVVFAAFEILDDSSIVGPG